MTDLPYKWKLFYVDGSSFSDLDGEPHESFSDEVLFLVQPNSEPPIMLNADWLMWRVDYGEWTECGASGIDDHLRLYGHLIGCFRKTLWIRTENYKRIWRQAQDELGMP